MADDAFIARTLGDLEAEALKILDSVAAGHREPDGATLALLHNVAGQSARTAYGNNRPELLSATMRRLISWCDHLDEECHVNEFKTALRHRPLPSPPWSARHG